MAVQWPVLSVNHTTMTHSPEQTPPSRKGPYGPALAFIPKGQEITWVDGKDTLLAALERLAGDGYSQAPVRHYGRCIGMLEVSRVLQALLEQPAFRELASAMPAGDLTSPPRFLGKDEWIDQNFDWLADDVALVGLPEQLEGLITPSDVLRRVNDYTEAFSVIAEIEEECRELIGLLYPSEQHRAMLHDVLKRTLKTGAGSFLPLKSEEFGFQHYAILFAHPELFGHIEPHCHWSRGKLEYELNRARHLRNEVMHFKRQAEAAEVDRLRVLCNQLVEIERSMRAAPRVDDAH